MVLSTEVKYPDVVVHLTGENGNAMNILCKVRRALKQSGVSYSEVEQYTREATSGDYDNLLQVTMRYVTVEY